MKWLLRQLPILALIFPSAAWACHPVLKCVEVSTGGNVAYFGFEGGESYLPIGTKNKFSGATGCSSSGQNCGQGTIFNNNGPSEADKFGSDSIVAGATLLPVAFSTSVTWTLSGSSVTATKASKSCVPATPTPTRTASVTPTRTATAIPTNTAPPPPTHTSTPLPTATFTPTSTRTSTPVPPTATFTATATHTTTPLPTNTSTPPPTLTPTSTKTSTPVPPTATFTATSTHTATPPPTNSPTPPSTLTPTSTSTSTPVPPTATATATYTSTPLPTNTGTATPTSTATNTATPMPDATNTSISTPTPVATATETPETTPIPLNTPEVTPQPTTTPGIEIFDCNGVPGGNSKIDCCGVCGGDGTSCPNLCKEVNNKPAKKKILVAVKKISDDTLKRISRELQCDKKSHGAKQRRTEVSQLRRQIKYLLIGIEDNFKLCDTPFCSKSSYEEWYVEI